MSLTAQEKEELKRLEEEETEGNSFLEEAGQTAKDIAVASASDFAYDFLDEGIAGAAATYEKLAHGKDWNESYRKYQKIAEKIVNDARENSPVSTTIAGFLTPGLGGELAIAKKIAQSGIIRQLAKTAIESGASSVGRSGSDKKLSDTAWDAVEAAGTGVAVHGAFKGTGKLFDLFAGGKEKVAAAMMNAKTKDIVKHAKKSGGKGKSGDESAKDLFADMFDSGLITKKNVDYDPNAGEFYKVGKEAYPKIGDIERNVGKAKDVLGGEISGILKIHGNLTPQQEKVLLSDIVATARKQINETKYGDDKIKALKILDEFENQKIPDVLSAHPNSNYLVKLDKIRQSIDSKHASTYGVDANAAITKDVDKLIANTLRSKIRKAIPDNNESQRLKGYYKKYTDLSDAGTGLKVGGVETITGPQEAAPYPRLAAMGKKAAEVIREKVEVPFYDIKATPPTNKFLFPGRSNKAALGETPQRIARELGAQTTRPEEEEIAPMEEGMIPPIQMRGPKSLGEQEELPDPREARIAQLKEEKQKAALEKLRLSKLPRNSDEFIANRELVLGKFAQQAPEELANMAHIITNEPERIEDAVTLYSTQFPELFVSDVYKRVNGKIIDNNAKMQARKDTSNREDLSNTEKANILNRLNKTGEFDADKRPVVEAPKKKVDLTQTYQELGSMRSKSPAGEVTSEAPLPPISI